MTYTGATRYVEGLAILGMRFGLERMHRILDALDRPHECAPAIHVVGTNGKSSTCRLAAAALRSQGMRVGTYISPHVTGWRERIEVDERSIGQTRFADGITAVRDAVETLGLVGEDEVTQFEVLTAGAFAVFAQAGVDAMVIEAGLGGRFDATNVLTAGTVVALTNVALEHTELLGGTEGEIAAEKLAVASDGSDRLVIGRLSDRAEPAVARELASRGLSGWRVGDGIDVRRWARGVDVTTPGASYTALPLTLHGDFQIDNLAVAVAAAERRLGSPLRVGPLRRAIGRVRMPGRMEVVARNPLTVLDGAHNPAAVEAMAASLRSVVGRRTIVAVVSVLGDKDAAAMVTPLAGICEAMVATRSSHRRAAAPDVLRHLATLAGMRGEAVEDPLEAITRARVLAGRGGAVLICGSLYLLADIRAQVMAGPAGTADMLRRASGRKSR
jgi:dihydrofolate synthase/folylpolyglutamate synthase